MKKVKSRFKKIIAVILSATMLLSVSSTAISVTAAEINTASSVSETSGDFEYEVLDDGTVEITKYTGSATEFEIPSEIDGKKVTSIGSSAFYNCTSLENIIIPDSVITISGNAFFNCLELKSVFISENVNAVGAYYGEDDFSRAFSGCENLEKIEVDKNNNYFCSFDGVIYNKSFTKLLYYPRGKKDVSFLVPCGIENIEKSAFYHNANLKNLTISGSVKEIDGIVSYCQNLSHITLESGVKTIGYEAFEQCENLVSISIPDTVTIIESYAFRNCVNLTKIAIPDGVTHIGYGAFYGCTKLASVTASRNLVSVEASAFDNTCWYDNQPDGVIYVGKVAYTYKGDKSELVSLELRSDTKGIAEKAFYSCSALENITIPENIESVGIGAFSDTQWYDNLPDGLVYVGKAVYEYKGEMPENTVLSLQDGTKSITESAFEKQKNLKDIIIPNSVEYVGASAFADCVNITSIAFPDGVKELSDYLFYGCVNLEEFQIPSSVTSVGDSVFKSCENLKKIDIPVNITSIGAYAFSGCKGITEIIIPEKVTSLGIDVFADCTNLKTVKINASLKKIPSGAFSGCASLEEINIPVSVDTIAGVFAGTVKGNGSFEDCISLKEIIIPENVRYYDGFNAFINCKNLKNITILSKCNSKDFSMFLSTSYLGYEGYPTNTKPIEGTTIYGYKGTMVESYANENGFTFIALDEEDKNDDINNDGNVDVNDVTVLQMHLANYDIEVNAQALDVNNDDNVDVTDVTTLQMILAGYDI